MSKTLKFIVTFLILCGCSYEPVLLKKKYDFHFDKINSTGEIKINEIIINELSERAKYKNSVKYDIYFVSKKSREIISSNSKGDPKIYKLRLDIAYNLIKDNQIILKNDILKQATYNNINDKFELLKYEENIIQNLSRRIADDILVSVTTLAR